MAPKVRQPLRYGRSDSDNILNALRTSVGADRGVRFKVQTDVLPTATAVHLETSDTLLSDFIHGTSANKRQCCCSMLRVKQSEGRQPNHHASLTIHVDSTPATLSGTTAIGAQQGKTTNPSPIRCMLEYV